MIVVNLYGGPGTGKSTMAARVFSELKELGHNAELVTEYAKDLTWQKSTYVLGNQIHIFGEQQHRLWRLREGVDIVVTDSPLPQGLLYCNPSRTFIKLVMEEFHKFQNINVSLRRVKAYNPKGRSQTLDEAMELDADMKALANVLGLDFDLEVDGRKDSTETIVKLVEDASNKK